MHYIRPLPGDFQIRAAAPGDDGDWVIEGLACRTAYSYDLGGWYDFTESVAPGAFTSLDTDEVNLLINHEGLPLANTRSGTLTLAETDDGLTYRGTIAGDDPDGVSLRSKIKAGAVWGSSMGFVIRKIEWDHENDHRTITDLELFDVSPVGTPANPATSVSVGEERDLLAAMLRQPPGNITGRDTTEFRAVMQEFLDKSINDIRHRLVPEIRAMIEDTLAARPPGDPAPDTETLLMRAKAMIGGSR